MAVWRPGCRVQCATSRAFTAWLLAAQVLSTLSGEVSPDAEKYCPTLTEATFDGYFADSKVPVLVMFHVDWCKVCQRALPHYLSAAEEVTTRGLGIRVAHVDCGTDKPLCQRFSIRGYPSIMLFEDPRSAETYRPCKCSRTKDGFLNYMQRMIREPVRALSDKEASGSSLESALTSETLVGIAAAAGTPAPPGLAGPADWWRDRHTFVSVAKLDSILPASLRSAAKGASLVAYSTASQQWAADNKTSTPAMFAYNGKLDSNETVFSWLLTHRFPGIWRLNDTNFFEFTHAKRKAVIVAINPRQDNKPVEAAIRKAQQALSEEFIFGVLDGADWAEPLQDFNIQSAELPRVLVTENDFEEWVEDVDQLGVENLEQDLKNLRDGAPLLRQGRTAWSKVKFYGRESSRTATKAIVFARQGPLQMFAVAMVFCAGVGAIALVFWCSTMLIKELLGDGMEPRPHED